MIDVSIIILNYKSRGLIRQQLRHFFDEKNTDSYEVIVVDNDSKDGIANMLAKEFPQVRCIESRKNGGYASGNNIGLREAKGAYCLIVNPDILLTSNLVSGLFQFMEEHTAVGIAGPKIENPDESLQYSCVRFPDIWLPLFRRTFFARTRRGRRWLDWYFMRNWDHKTARDVDWLYGACLIVRRSALDRVGLLDERFFLYLEDTDWCRRFWEAGFSVYYVPTVSAVHLLGRESAGAPLAVFFNRLARTHLLSFGKYVLKYWGKPNPHRERVSNQAS